MSLYCLPSVPSRSSLPLSFPSSLPTVVDFLSPLLLLFLFSLSPFFATPSFSLSHQSTVDFPSSLYFPTTSLSLSFSFINHFLFDCHIPLASMASHTRSSRPPPHHHFSFSSTLLSVLILISILLSSTPLSAAQAQTPFTPVPVYGAAFARSGTHLFVLGGNPSTAPGTPSTDQFMALDLSTAWTTAAPAWIQLQPGPKKFNFPATFSKDLSTLYAFHIPSTTTSSSVQQYTIKTGRWAVVDVSPFYGSVDGPGAVTDPNTGIIYCAGGCATPGQDKLQYWDPVKPTLVNVVTLPLPASPLPANGPVGVFQTRNYYANVWVERLKGIAYFGGYGSIRPDNTVSLYTIATGNFTTLVSYCLEGKKKRVGVGRLDYEILSPWQRRNVPVRMFDYRSFQPFLLKHSLFSLSLFKRNRELLAPLHLTLSTTAWLQVS